MSNDPQTTPVYILNKMLDGLNVSIGGGEIVRVSVDGLGKDVVGVMLVYKKIPKGEKKENFIEAETWKNQ